MATAGDPQRPARPDRRRAAEAAPRDRGRPYPCGQRTGGGCHPHASHRRGTHEGKYQDNARSRKMTDTHFTGQGTYHIWRCSYRNSGCWVPHQRPGVA